MKILVFAPHPDDEVLGCGGTIKKYSDLGSNVSLCIATKAYTPDWTEEFIEKRKQEIKDSCAVLGVKEVVFLDLPTVKLDTIPQKELNDKILEAVKRVDPEIVFIPFQGDVNNDHKLISEASLVALRPKPDLKVKKIFWYEVLSETDWIKPAQKTEEIFRPNYYEDISDCLDFKLKAMQCYGSELKEYPHPRSLEGIKVLAQKRGMESGLESAEAFMLLREIAK